MEDKKNNIFLSVIGIATLLVAIVGATFAYFTTTLTGNTQANVTANTAKVGGITVNASGISSSGVIYPGWSQEATITGKLDTDTDVATGYVCNLTFSNLGTIDEDNIVVSTKTGSGSYTTVTKSNDSYTVAEYTFAAGSTASSTETVTTTYKVEYTNLESAQNDEQGSSIVGTVVCSLTSSSSLKYKENNTNNSYVTY